MHATTDDEAKRTSALALWRYGHDYLKAARTLCEADRVTCGESQALHHLTAQGIEFALKSYLRAQEVTAADLAQRLGHALPRALAEAVAHGLPPPPVAVARAIAVLAPCHGDEAFHYLRTEPDAIPDLAPFIAAGAWVLAQAAEGAVADHYAHHAAGATAAPEEMLRRMRADLEGTASAVAPPAL